MRRKCQPALDRRGVLIAEVIVSLALVGVVLALSVQMLTSTALERRYVEQRAIALVQAANLAERISALSYADVTSEKLQAIQASADLESLLKGAKAELQLVEPPAGSSNPAGKQVRIEIKWTATGRPQGPVRLSCWVFPSGGAP